MNENNKNRTILFTILFALIVVHQQCGVTALNEVDDPVHMVDSVNDSIDDLRRLENVHKQGTKPLFNVLLASIIVNVVSLITLLSLIPVLTKSKWSCFKSVFWVANANLPTENKTDKKQETATHLSDISFPSVACGVILATASFLIIPEAILFIQRGTSSEEGEIEILTGTVSRFGAALMTGYVLPLMLGALFPRSSELSSKELAEILSHRNNKRKTSNIVDKKERIEDNEEKSPQISECFDDELPPQQNELQQSDTFECSDAGSTGGLNEMKSKKYNIAASILIGGTIRNFFDGIYIGVAFLTCSNAAKVCVTLTTIYTQVTHEMADYFLLMNYTGISIPRALLLNLIAGLVVVVGALSIVSADMNELAIGVFLAFAAGVYLHISASECLPRVYSVVKVSRDRWISLFFFIIGALPIGLTLLGDRHCDA